MDARAGFEDGASTPFIFFKFISLPSRFQPQHCGRKKFSNRSFFNLRSESSLYNIFLKILIF